MRGEPPERQMGLIINQCPGKKGATLARGSGRRGRKGKRQHRGGGNVRKRTREKIDKLLEIAWHAGGELDKHKVDCGTGAIPTPGASFKKSTAGGGGEGKKRPGRGVEKGISVPKIRIRGINESERKKTKAKKKKKRE